MMVRPMWVWKTGKAVEGMETFTSTFTLTGWRATFTFGSIAWNCDESHRMEVV